LKPLRNKIPRHVLTAVGGALKHIERDKLNAFAQPHKVGLCRDNACGATDARVSAAGRTRDGRRLLLLAQANAFTGVLTGAGDALDLRHAALRRGWHTHPGGGVLHLTAGALGYRCRRAGRWYDEEGDRRRCRDRDRESTGKD